MLEVDSLYTYGSLHYNRHTLGVNLIEVVKVLEVALQVLIGDFFFILLALLWFGVAIGLSASNVATGPLDAWYNLWKPVFQPALGVLMVGALVSGFTGRKEQ